MATWTDPKVPFQSTPLSIERSDELSTAESRTFSQFQSTPLSIERSDAGMTATTPSGNRFNPRPSP